MLKEDVHIEPLSYQRFNMLLLVLDCSKEPGRRPHAPHLSDKLPHKHGGRRRYTINLKCVYSSTRGSS
jgi:hypothetical protein